MKTFADQEEGLLEFPCEIMVKAMGLADDDFELLVVELVRTHVRDLGEGAVTSRPSSSSKYLSVSVRVQAQSREQMDALYRALSDHQRILMAL